MIFCLELATNFLSGSSGILQYLLHTKQFHKFMITAYVLNSILYNCVWRRLVFESGRLWKRYCVTIPLKAFSWKIWTTLILLIPRTSSATALELCTNQGKRQTSRYHGALPQLTANALSNLLRSLLSKIKIPLLDGAPLLPLELFEQIGDLSFDQLSNLRHRGAFSTVSLTFTMCCILTQYTGPGAVTKMDHMLKKWYDVCAQYWLVSLKDVYWPVYLENFGLCQLPNLNHTTIRWHPVPSHWHHGSEIT